MAGKVQASIGISIEVDSRYMNQMSEAQQKAVREGVAEIVRLAAADTMHHCDPPPFVFYGENDGSGI